MLVETAKINKQEVTVVSSLDVAETFGKEHNHVLRDIRELECSNEFRQSNFGQIYYEDKYGRKQKAYAITRDGFTLLVMGYTGEKAMKFKEAYIKQFQEISGLCGSHADPRLSAPLYLFHRQGQAAVFDGARDSIFQD